jgi:hypothetical protein
MEFFDKLLMTMFIVSVAVLSFSFGVISVAEPVALWGNIPIEPQGNFIGNSSELRMVLTEVAIHSATEHYYSIDDGYVCLDMAIDVWNLLKKRGIVSYIAIGNVTYGCGDFGCANHAWVVVPAPDGSEIAIETTGGFLPIDRGYYTGMRFATPHDFEVAWARYNDIHKVY